MEEKKHNYKIKEVSMLFKDLGCGDDGRFITKAEASLKTGANEYMKLREAVIWKGRKVNAVRLLDGGPYHYFKPNTEVIRIT